MYITKHYRTLFILKPKFLINVILHVNTQIDSKLEKTLFFARLMAVLLSFFMASATIIMRKINVHAHAFLTS